MTYLCKVNRETGVVNSVQILSSHFPTPYSQK